MTALQINRKDGEQKPVSAAVKVRELAQQEALERLIALLQPEAAADPSGPMPAYRWDDTLNRQARLRAARAAYVLNTSDKMIRVGPGAWMRRKGS